MILEKEAWEVGEWGNLLPPSGHKGTQSGSGTALEWNYKEGGLGKMQGTPHTHTVQGRQGRREAARKRTLGASSGAKMASAVSLQILVGRRPMGHRSP